MKARKEWNRIEPIMVHINKVEKSDFSTFSTVTQYNCARVSLLISMLEMARSKFLFNSHHVACCVLKQILINKL